MAQIITNKRERINKRPGKSHEYVEESDDGRGGSDVLSSKDLDTHIIGKNPNFIPIGKFKDRLHWNVYGENPIPIPLSELDWDKSKEDQFEGMILLRSKMKLDLNTHKRKSRKRRAGTSRVSVPLHRFLKEKQEYDDDGKEEEYDYGGGDVLATDIDTNLSLFDKPKEEEEEYDDGRGGGEYVLATKSEKLSALNAELSQFTWALNKSCSSLCPFGETDVDSSNSEEDDYDDEKSEDGYEVVPANTPWSYAVEDVQEEIRQLQLREKSKSHVLLLSGRILPPIRKRIIYQVYVDAYFRKNRLPRYGILVKDPSETDTFGYVGRSKSKSVPQLQTHLEGLLKGAKLVKSLINKKPHQQGKIDIWIFSNNSYVVDFVNVKGEPPYKEEHFTQDVKNLMRDLILYTYQNNMTVNRTTYFKNGPADHLARSSTSKLWEKIPKKNFDKELKDLIKLLEQYEDVKRRWREVYFAEPQKHESYLSALLS